MQTTIQQLQAVRETLAKPEAWARQYYAYDEYGDRCLWWEHKAVSWCLNGAVLRCAAHNLQGMVYLLEKQLPKGFTTLVEYNDNNGVTHTEILALIDRAIAAEQTK